MSLLATTAEPVKVVLTGDNQAIVVQSPSQVLPVVVESGGPQGPSGESGEGGGDLHYVFTQGSPSVKWTITHNLNKFPSVFVQDSANDEVEGDVEYVNINQVVITFSAAFSGKAYLN